MKSMTTADIYKKHIYFYKRSEQNQVWLWIWWLCGYGYTAAITSETNLSLFRLSWRWSDGDGGRDLWRWSLQSSLSLGFFNVHASGQHVLLRRCPCETFGSHAWQSRHDFGLLVWSGCSLPLWSTLVGHSFSCDTIEDERSTYARFFFCCLRGGWLFTRQFDSYAQKIVMCVVSQGPKTITCRQHLLMVMIFIEFFPYLRGRSYKVLSMICKSNVHIYL